MSMNSEKAKKGRPAKVRWPDLVLPPINLYNAPILGCYGKKQVSKPRGHR
jgi:hypothetical protein